MSQRHLALTASIASLACVLATPAHAAGKPGDFYFLASLGRTTILQTQFQADNNAAIMNNLSGGGTVRNMHSTQTSSQGAFKLQMGVDFTPRIAIEGGYVDLGKTNYSASYTYQFKPTSVGTATNGATQTYDPFSTVSNRQAKITGWTVAAVGKHPINEKLDVFAKLGLIHSEVRTDDRSVGENFFPNFGFGSHYNDTEHKLRPTYGVGASYKVTKVLGVRAEFEKFSKVGNSQTVGSTDINLMSVGVTGRF